MPNVVVAPVGQGQFFDDSGNPLAGGKIYTYVGGSFSVKSTTYSNYQGTIAHANPIVLDSAGRVPGTIWIVAGQRYNIVVTRSNGTTISQSWENIIASNGSGPPPPPPPPPVDRYFTSALYPFVLTDSVSTSSATITSGNLLLPNTDGLETGTATLETGTLETTIAYVTVDPHTPDDLVTANASVESGILTSVINYITVDPHTPDSINTSNASVQSGSLTTVINYITNNNAIPEPISTYNATILTGALV